MQGAWKSGTWLGQSGKNNGHVVHGDSGVEEVWTVRRKPEGERWNKDAITAIRGRPGRIDQHEGQRYQVRVRVEDDEVIGEAKRTHFKDAAFEKYGFTVGCPGCETRGKKGLRMRGHTEQCRQRIEAELAKEKNERWRRAAMRRGEWSAPEAEQEKPEDQQDSPERVNERKRAMNEEDMRWRRGSRTTGGVGEECR